MTTIVTLRCFCPEWAQPVCGLPSNPWFQTGVLSSPSGSGRNKRGTCLLPKTLRQTLWIPSGPLRTRATLKPLQMTDQGLPAMLPTPAVRTVSRAAKWPRAERTALRRRTQYTRIKRVFIPTSRRRNVTLLPQLPLPWVRGQDLLLSLIHI